MVSEQPRVLLVDDDAEMRELLVETLAENGYETRTAANGAEALLRLHREPFAAIVLDKNMPGLSALDLLPGLGLLCPRTPVVIITAFGDAHTRTTAAEKGAYGFLDKPFRMDDLLAMLQRALAESGSPADTRTAASPPPRRLP
jgi:DNA-binding NtrC family response regulator